MKFGRIGVKTDYRTLRLSEYITPSLEAPPSAFSSIERIAAAVGDSDVTNLFPMDYNDTLGCCTIAGWAHMVTLFEGMVGRGLIPAADDVKRTYLALSGGEDTGLFCLDVMKYVQTNAVLGGDKTLGYVSINPKNHTHVKQAIKLFGGVYLGFQVQGGAIPDFEARRPWDAAMNMTNEGHCVAACAYDDNASGYADKGGLLTVLTWGNIQQATWAWWDECVDEVYAILPAEASDSAFAPGIDFATLNGDLIAVRG